MGSLNITKELESIWCVLCGWWNSRFPPVFRPPDLCLCHHHITWISNPPPNPFRIDVCLFTWLPSTTIWGSWMASEPTVLNTSCSLLTTGIRASMMRIPSDEAGVFLVRQRFRFDEDRDEPGDGVTKNVARLVFLSGFCFFWLLCNWFFTHKRTVRAKAQEENRRIARKWGIRGSGMVECVRAPEGESWDWFCWGDRARRLIGVQSSC